MTFHVWGDPWFVSHGDTLHRAIHEVLRDWRRWGRLGSHGKEKFGSFRHHVEFYRGEWPIHELVKPGHVYYRWPRWAMHAELWLGRLVCTLRLDRPIRWWQGHVYNWALQRACRRYPSVVDELVSDADFPDLIRGRVDGRTIHDKYWVRLS